MSVEHIHILTNASLPWYTGTSINPFYRTIQLAKMGFTIGLFLPYVPPQDQRKIFPPDVCFYHEDEQRAFLAHKIPSALQSQIGILFYPAKLHARGYIKSIQWPIPKLADADLILIESAEHFMLLHFPKQMSIPKHKTIAILHTNPSPYIKNSYLKPLFFLLETFIEKYSAFYFKKNALKTIALSKAVANNKNFTVDNVNGVNNVFFNKPLKTLIGFYFIGKVIPEKNIHALLMPLAIANIKRLDIYGDAQYNATYTQQLQKTSSIKLCFKGITANPAEVLQQYKALINPSEIEVLCTTTAEALAMNKFVIIPKHPSNIFFYPFKNCLTYSNQDEFIAMIQYADNNHPTNNDPLVAQLNWEAATQRLIKHFPK